MATKIIKVKAVKSAQTTTGRQKTESHLMGKTSKAKEPSKIALPSVEKLFELGAHFGHQRYRSHPDFQEYVWQVRDGVMILDLSQTLDRLKLALDFLDKQSRLGKKILIVGTKRISRDLVERLGKETNTAWVSNRWLSGTLTNFATLIGQIKKLNRLSELIGSKEFEQMTKKERLIWERKLARLHDNFDGLSSLEARPDILVVIDGHAHRISTDEAKRLGITTVVFADSDTDPSLCDYLVPINDDSRSTIELVINLIGQAIGGARTSDQTTKPDSLVKSDRARARGLSKINNVQDVS